MRFLAILIIFAFSIGFPPASAEPLDDGNAAYERGDYEDAIKFWKLSADVGNPIAEYNLCQSYRYGDGVQADSSQAVKWCQRAAEKDDASAQILLASMYENGRDLKKDEAKAAMWYERAANEGDLYAQARIGVIYADGIGVKEDVVQAYKWFRLAQEANEKYYGWSTVVREMTSREKTAGEDIDRDLNQLTKRMTPEQIKEAESRVENWESVFKSSHPVKRKFSPLLFFFVFLLPACVVASVPGRQQRFYYGVRVSTWAIVSLLLFVPWFLAWSHGENLQNAPDSWMRAFAWTGAVMLVVVYLMKRCSSKALTFFDGMMFAIGSFGSYNGVHVIIAFPLFIIIAAASLAMALFYELTGRPEKTAVQYHKFIGFFYKHRHDAEK